MRRSRRLAPPAAALLLGLVGVLATPVAGDAETAAPAREHAVLLQLYTLDSRLDSSRSRLAALDSTAAQLGRERGLLSLRLRSARLTLRRAQRALGAELRALYEQAQPDPLAVVLAAASLQDAVDGVDALARAASATESVIAEARTARDDVTRLGRELAGRGRELARVRVGLAAEVASLERVRRERSAYLDELRRRDEQRAAELESRARAAEAQSRDLAVRAASRSSIASVGAEAAIDGPAAAASATVPAPGSAATPGRRTIVIVTTGYALPGMTASGLPVGRGIAAVDPAVIPLGTRMTIPGYGDAIAADTGPAIRGVRVDLWFPTLGQARAWGWQTLRVTLH